MSDYNYEQKTGHPVLGIVLGILGILCALLLTIVAGLIAGIIAGVLGLIAVLLGAAARKSGRGMGAIITGILAVALAVVMTVSVITVFREVQTKAEKYQAEAPLVVKCLNKPELALLGMILSMPKDEGSIQDLTEQFNRLKELDPETFQDRTAAPETTKAPESEATAAPAA